MNRVLLALGVVLACSGCAASVEDAQPEPTVDEPQRDPPKTPFSAPYEAPYTVFGNLDDLRPDLRVPPRALPRFPDPDPTVER
jgi:hypothetical protein